VARQLSQGELHRLLTEMRERGYCVVEDAWSNEEGCRVRNLFDRLLERVIAHRGEDCFSGFGCKVLSLWHREPRVREFFEAPPILGFLEHAFEDQARYKMTGVRWSTLVSQPRIIWHDHYYWDPALLAQRTRFERISLNCYLEGSTREMGPLIVLPRAFRDPLHAHRDDPCAPISGEVEVEVPPLSVVFMDSALEHCARRGTSPRVRTMWGGQAQARSCRRAHPQDTDGAWSAVQAWRWRKAELG
jgi:hypothetical protein